MTHALRILLLAVVAILAIAGVALWLALRAEPTYWQKACVTRNNVIFCEVQR